LQQSSATCLSFVLRVGHFPAYEVAGPEIMFAGRGPLARRAVHHCAPLQVEVGIVAVVLVRARVAACPVLDLQSRYRDESLALDDDALANLTLRTEHGAPFRAHHFPDGHCRMYCIARSHWSPKA
jgi:hypothetical protein